MNDRYFLDTNIFVYSFDDQHPEKRKRARQLIAQALDSEMGFVSNQVVQEFFAVARRKFARPLSIDDAQEYLHTVFNPLCEVFSSIDLYSQALTLQDQSGYSFYDALIVAAALQCDCTILYSEDLQANRKFGKMKIINPFTD